MRPAAFKWFDSWRKDKTMIFRTLTKKKCYKNNFGDTVQSSDDSVTKGYVIQQWVFSLRWDMSDTRLSAENFSVCPVVPPSQLLLIQHWSKLCLCVYHCFSKMILSICSNHSLMININILSLCKVFKHFSGTGERVRFFLLCNYKTCVTNVLKINLSLNENVLNQIIWETKKWKAFIFKWHVPLTTSILQHFRLFLWWSITATVNQHEKYFLLYCHLLTVSLAGLPIAIERNRIEMNRIELNRME